MPAIALLTFDRFRGALRAALLVGSLGAMALPAQAAEWPKSDIAPDPAVTFGVLPNGMRYAIMHNATPTGAVSVRLRIGAGAMQERPDQRGLAHFLEHMAFRGSTHVADGEIDKELERLGLTFGADTNASTGQTETVYQFDMPRSDDQTVDTVLGYTREIASNLNLDQAAANTEAGVVLSELKMRDTPGLRAEQAMLDFTLQDPHATAMASGNPAIVAKAPVALIREFYHAYYRPERATLVVVGDVDPAQMEAKIKARFGDWQGVGPAGTDPVLHIAQSRSPEAAVAVAPQSPHRIAVTWVRPAASRPQDKAAEKQTLVDYVAMQILNRRFSDASAVLQPPFVRARVSQDQVVDAAELVSLNLGFEPGHWQAALAAAEKEIRLNLLQSGVSQAEVDRSVAELHKVFESESLGAPTRPSRAVMTSLLQAISDNEIFTSPGQDLIAANLDMKDLTADAVTRSLRQLFTGRGPLVFLSDTDAVKGGAAAVEAAFVDADKAAMAAPATLAKNDAPAAWPYTDFGKAGAVVERKEVADLGTSFVRFANGVRLAVRPSKLRDNQVLVSVKVGGGRLDLPTDRVTAAWAAGAVPAGGLKALSYSDMQNVLATKSYRVNFGIREDGFVFSGRTTPDDIDTQMQVLAAYVKEPGFRPEGFEQVRNSYVARLAQIDANPAAIMQLKGPMIMHDGDKRWASPTDEQVQGAKVDELKALLAPVFATGAVDITIVGDVTVDKAIQSVAATFGALPQRSSSRPIVGAANNTHFPTAKAPITIPGSEGNGQEIVSVAWPTHGEFPDIQDGVTLQLMSAIMEDRLFDRLRGKGSVYVARVGNTSSPVFDYGYVQALAQLPPERAQQFYDAVSDIAAELEAGKLTDDDLARAKNPALQALRKDQQTNDYWLAILDDAQENPAKLELARHYEAALDKVSLGDIEAAARKYLARPDVIKLTTGS